MTNNTTTTTTTTRRVRRNNIIKNIFMVLMAIALIILVIFVFKGCNKDNASDTNNPGFIPTIGCTCTEADKCKCSGNGTTDNSALLVEIDLLKAERDALKAENESLKSGASVDEKALADAKADAASWKSKYETLYKTHQSCTSVDLSKYVCAEDYNKLAAELAAFKSNHANCIDNDSYQAVVNELAKWKNHKCSSDHSNCVAKSTYQAALEELAGWRNHKCPTANHSNCVSQSEYNTLNNKYQNALSRISTLEAELAELKAHKCPGADHTACYNKIVALEAEITQLKAELKQLQSHKCDHTNCGTGTTIIQADHSNCVSLRDYNELLAKYNALLDN